MTRVRRSVVLRREPTMREASVILERIERELRERGAAVARAGRGGLRFRTPTPWRAPHLGALAAISSGNVDVSAGGGGPWRVRYTLEFTLLRNLCLAVSVALVVAGWGWARSALLGALLAVWGVGIGAALLVAAPRFHRLVRAAARDFAERRQMPRPDANSAPGGGVSPR